MFFETSDFSVNDIAVFKFSWGAHKANSKIRPYHALSFRIKGDAKFIHGEDVVEVKTGDILFVPAYYKYTLNSDKESVFVIHFTANKKLPEKIKKFSPENAELYKRRFEELYNVWEKKQLGYEHECRYLMHKLMLSIERDFEENKMRGEGKIRYALDYIHDNFTASDISVAKLASYCNMSETYFRKLFLRSYGATPLEYINKLKTQYAVDLLRSKYYTVCEVSDKCGFCNVYYFSAFMKRQTGHPPSDFLKDI